MKTLDEIRDEFNLEDFAIAAVEILSKDDLYGLDDKIMEIKDRIESAGYPVERSRLLAESMVTDVALMTLVDLFKKEAK